MPVKSHQIEGGARVLIFTCDTCGEPACYGHGVNLRKALESGHVEDCGAWYCADHDPDFGTKAQADAGVVAAPGAGGESTLPQGDLPDPGPAALALTEPQPLPAQSAPRETAESTDASDGRGEDTGDLFGY